MTVRSSPEAVKPLTNPFLGAALPLGSLITAAGQRLSAKLDQALREAGFDDVRAAHAPMFMAIDPYGTRLVELARRTRMSKQAAGELARHLTVRGYLAAEPDPADRRARILSLTPRGWDAIDTGAHVIAEFDRWLAELVGPEQVVLVRHVLDQIIGADTEG